ncbi:hypothetical protein ACQR2B_06520 [Bradyrhizobium oligotrophicum]|uniref:hypothetical protein n=1 Tax=Bradyrhizobium TaxID=374 RepID=UPI003EC09D05
MALIAGFLTGGLSLILSFLGPLVPGLAATIGDTIIKARQTQAAREGKQDEAAVSFGHSWLASVTEANRSRAEARKNEGAWGPMGIVTFLIGLALAYHVWLVVLDSSPFYPVPALRFYVVPWFEWQAHKVGSWGVETLGKLHETELAILQALFYVAPPAAAIAIAAKAFRR